MNGIRDQLKYSTRNVDCRDYNLGKRARRAIASLIWYWGTHFMPKNYWKHGMNWRVRDAIEQIVERNPRQCAYD